MASEAPDTDRLWRFDTIDAFSVPSEPIHTGRVREGLGTLMRSIVGHAEKKESPLDPEDDLLTLSGDRLSDATPRFDWSAAGRALDERLRPWLDAGDAFPPVVFFVTPPYTGRRQILTEWAKQNDAAVIRAPREKQILSGNTRWLRSWPERGWWVLPDLEKTFLRRADGLDLVRETLSHLLSGSLGRGIVGCDGWAWRFLQRVWLGRPSFTVTPLGFDAERLHRLFCESIPHADTGEGRFRLSDSGGHLLRCENEGESRMERGPEQFWRSLAAYSRGNIGVAAAHWSRALRALPEADQDLAEDEARHRNQTTIWVTPWSGLDQPRMPRESGQTALFALHALLIHGGLDTDRLAAILPADRTGVMEALLFLREADLVEPADDEWRVTPWGYPVVRGTLLANDYLCDPF